MWMLFVCRIWVRELVLPLMPCAFVYSILRWVSACFIIIFIFFFFIFFFGAMIVWCLVNACLFIIYEEMF